MEIRKYGINGLWENTLDSSVEKTEILAIELDSHILHQKECALKDIATTRAGLETQKLRLDILQNTYPIDIHKFNHEVQSIKETQRELADLEFIFKQLFPE